MATAFLSRCCVSLHPFHQLSSCLRGKAGTLRLLRNAANTSLSRCENLGVWIARHLSKSCAAFVTNLFDICRKRLRQLSRIRVTITKTSAYLTSCNHQTGFLHHRGIVGAASSLHPFHQLSSCLRGKAGTLRLLWNAFFRRYGAPPYHKQQTWMQQVTTPFRAMISTS